MKIENINFPKSLLDALRDNKLVVFAGAGVSMGEPACLPNFESLTNVIAKDTRKTPRTGEKFEEFLGRLQDEGVKVHLRAKQELSQEGLKATNLHRDLLRLYRKAEPVRLITTNFDLLFEQAAEGMFDNSPEVFRAPALPLGREFDGIIHVHGSVRRPNEMVLTDKDFGRAYLTEGWAQRFLVELFSNFRILFVGYSHDDTIMSYLARALPGGSEYQRFILTGSEDKKPNDDWRSLGIEPIVYPQANKNDYSKLDTGIHGLAELVQRSVVEWKNKITEIAQDSPTVDETKTDLIEYALGDETKTRFFTQAAIDPKWVDWLDEHGHLTGLFRGGILTEQAKILSWWLADRFVYSHPNKLFLLISKHNTSLHPRFWDDVARKLGTNTETFQDKKVQSRWLSLLLLTAPTEGDTTDGEYVFTSNRLGSIGKRCIAYEMFEDLLLIFDTMTQSRLLIRGGHLLPGEDEDEENLLFDMELRLLGKYNELNELWEQGLKPNLSQVVKPLLNRVIQRIEDQYLIFRTWGRADCQLESASQARSAIEDHEQNVGGDESDVLINVARDCLDWLALNQPEVSAQWCNRLVNSDSPLQRRLAVHGFSERKDLTPDDKIEWLLAHIDLHEYSLHHEVFQTVCQVYPKASSKWRKGLIEAAWAYHWTNAEHPDNREVTAREHFNWFYWLHKSDPTCPLAKQALNKIWAEYPHFKPKQYPDLTSWIQRGYVGIPNPLNLARPAIDCLCMLLPVETTVSDNLELRDKTKAIAEATRQDFAWSLDLAKALAEVGKWDVYIWRALIDAWSKMELDEDRHSQVFRWLAKTELYPKHSHEIAEALYALVKNGGPSYAFNLLPQANHIAEALWKTLDRTELIEPTRGWFEASINYPVWGITNYWLSAISLWRKQQDPVPTALSDEYRRVLSGIIKDSSQLGSLGKAILTSELAFLLAVDEEWVREHLLPLFEPENDDFQATWDGFVTLGRLNPIVAKAMTTPFLKAVEHINTDLFNQRYEFVKCYTAMLVYFAEDPLSEWIPKLFENDSQENPSSGSEPMLFPRDNRSIAEIFASEMSSHLQNMPETEQRELWEGWLKDYWQNRLDGVPARLTSGEAKLMLDWLTDLTAVFPEAVNLAIQMPSSPLQDSRVLSCIEIDCIWQNHPQAVGKLLIYLWKGNLPRHYWGLVQKRMDKLLPLDISSNLKQELQDIKIQL